ncbi:hypothetical protein ELQ39_28145 [Streptomyces sp. GB4-14]|uniref:hypothetical protein n=1 Tax=Streptomyces sp. GB4-14 TaxID=2498703 RepID=UPI001F5E49A5|nr:hypothetical protein [Streptomyces sp. GB4-14]
MTFTPRTWIVGEVVSAATMNQEIRDQFNSMFAAWTAYTPTWTASTTNPSLGNAVLTGRYMKYGRTVLVSIKLTMGSTTTYGTGLWRFALPTPAASAQDTVGTIFIGDASAGYSTGVAYLAASGTDIGGYVGATNAAAGLANGNPQTFAAGDRVWITVCYEAAS